ncbi:unnamed protein product [Arctogadus glacialis]
MLSKQMGFLTDREHGLAQERLHSEHLAGKLIGLGAELDRLQKAGLAHSEAGRPASVESHSLQIEQLTKANSALEKVRQQHGDCPGKLALSSEIDSLNRTSRQLEEDLKRAHLQLSEGAHSQHVHGRSCLCIVLMATEVEALRARVIQKEQEVSDMRHSAISLASKHPNPSNHNKPDHNNHNNPSNHNKPDHNNHNNPSNHSKPNPNHSKPNPNHSNDPNPNDHSNHKTTPLK